MDVTDDRKVKVVTFKLKVGASAWWDQTQTNRRLAAELPHNSCLLMEHMIRERFLPIDWKQILY